MLDYIYIDYLSYILPYSLFIAMGFFLACVIFRIVYGDNKIVRGFLFFSVVAFFSAIIYPNFEPYGGGPHSNCNGKFEYEAQAVASALADYFAVPTRTQIPRYSDLIVSGNYPSEKIDLKRRAKLFKESEFSIDILGDDSDELRIVLSSKEGKCPFYRWKCPRRILGKIYVLRTGGSGASGWLNGYEDI